MRTRSVLGVVAAASVAASLLLVPSAANAAQASFSNPLATPQTDDFDISTLDVSYSASAVSGTLHTQNYVGPSWEVDLYVISVPSYTFDGSGTSYVVDAYSDSGATQYDASTTVDGTSATASTTGVSVTRDDAGNAFTFSIPATMITWTGPVYFVTRAFDDNFDESDAAVSDTDALHGFGPLAQGALATTLTTALTSPTQKYGSPAAAAVAAVSPSTATGTVAFFDGATPLGAVAVTNGSATLPLSTTLATGAHQIHSTFTPTNDQNFSASASAAVPLTVVSAAKATKTTVTLSKKSQVFKKAAAKVKVTVSAKATGTVKLYDGKKVIKTVKVKAGKGSYTLSKKLAKGKHTFKAVFTATNVEAFTTSTSKTVKFTVKK